jgi:3-oxoacyl-[acyl-carrier protein] reductase
MISDIHPRRLEEAVAKLKEETGLAEIHGQLCNVTVEEEVQALVATAEARLGAWTCSSTTPAWAARSAWWT